MSPAPVARRRQRSAPAPRSDSATRARGAGTVSAARLLRTAMTLTAISPAAAPVTTRWVTDRPVAATTRLRTAASAPIWMCVAPHGLNRAAEKMTAASAMSSTMPGEAGPTGTGCSASRSPSTTPTVSSVASRLNGAPPIGARLRRPGLSRSAGSASPLVADGTTKRWTAGRISRSGNSAGSASSVSRLSVRMATRTIGMTAPVIAAASGVRATWVHFLCRGPAGTVGELVKTDVR